MAMTMEEPLVTTNSPSISHVDLKDRRSGRTDYYNHSRVGTIDAFEALDALAGHAISHQHIHTDTLTRAVEPPPKPLESLQSYHQSPPSHDSPILRPSGYPTATSTPDISLDVTPQDSKPQHVQSATVGGRNDTSPLSDKDKEDPTLQHQPPSQPPPSNSPSNIPTSSPYATLDYYPASTSANLPYSHLSPQSNKRNRAYSESYLLRPDGEEPQPFQPQYGVYGPQGIYREPVQPSRENSGNRYDTANTIPFLFPSDSPPAPSDGAQSVQRADGAVTRQHSDPSGAPPVRPLASSTSAFGPVVAPNFNPDDPFLGVVTLRSNCTITNSPLPTSPVLTRKRASSTTQSPVWNHYEVIHEGKARGKRRCGHCQAIFSPNSSTSTLARHLKRHRAQIEKGESLRTNMYPSPHGMVGIYGHPHSMPPTGHALDHHIESHPMDPHGMDGNPGKRVKLEGEMSPGAAINGTALAGSYPMVPPLSSNGSSYYRFESPTPRSSFTSPVTSPIVSAQGPQPTALEPFPGAPTNPAIAEYLAPGRRRPRSASSPHRIGVKSVAGLSGPGGPIQPSSQLGRNVMSAEDGFVASAGMTFGMAASGAAQPVVEDPTLQISPQVVSPPSGQPQPYVPQSSTTPWPCS